MPNVKQQSIKWAIWLCLSGWTIVSSASGFQLFEANGAGTGNFGADMAAGTDDAGNSYFNPAGLMYLTQPQMVLSMVNLFYSDKFQDSSTWQNPPATAALNGVLNTQLPNTYTSHGTAQGGAYALIPGFDIATPINDSMAFGFAIAAPFGLKTTYAPDTFLNYAATQTAVYDIDYAPSLAFRFTRDLTFGLGTDLENIDAHLNGVAGLPNLNPLSPATYDTQSRNEASGWGYGWHTGLMDQITPKTRMGIDYHSKVSVRVDGDSKFIGPLAGGANSLVIPNYSAIFQNNNLTINTTLPAWSQIGFDHRFNDQFTLSGTATYTQWHVFDNLTLHNVAATDNNFNPTALTLNIPEHFHNTWRFGLGAAYQLCPKWLLRTGVGYDQNPTNAHDRNVRLPDGNRVAAALGAHYQASKNVGLDVGYTHIWFQNASVNNTAILGTQQTTVHGKARSYADLIGLQLTLNLV